MIANQGPTRVKLAEGAKLQLTDRAGSVVAVVRGRIWITQQSDSRDLVFDAGERFELDRPGLAIVYSIGVASVLVLDPGTIGDPVQRARDRFAARIASRRAARAAGLPPQRPSAFELELELAARRMRGEAAARLLRLGAAWVERLWTSRTRDFARRPQPTRAGIAAGRPATPGPVECFE